MKSDPIPHWPGTGGSMNSAKPRRMNPPQEPR